MSIEVSELSPKRFGGFVALRRRQLYRRAPASWSRCSGRPARARRRCCGSSPASSTADSGTVLFDGDDATRRGRRAIAASASSSSTTRCSAT